MIKTELETLREAYRAELLENTIPFWLAHGMDAEHGGILTHLDRDGSIYDEDKSVWFQGRFGWVAANLYNKFEARSEYLDAARSCVDFLVEHCYDSDGRMFFHVSRAGRPIRKRRYAFSEAFAAGAFAAYARASGSAEYEQRSRDAFDAFVRHMWKPGMVPAKFSDERPMLGLGAPMIGIGIAQVLKDNIGGDGIDRQIDEWIETVAKYFMKPELNALMETVGPKGEVIDHVDGRTLNPGHAIEAAWFIMNVAKARGGDAALLEMGTTILDWMWEIGWDRQYGGILYFRDALGKPVQEYWHDMKFWWPQTEAIIATLMAYQMTGESKYLEWHRLAHDWAYAHFPDPEYGEWFGYLHRDGSLSNQAKGNLFKGPFHLPRMQMACCETIGAVLENDLSREA